MKNFLLLCVISDGTLARFALADVGKRPKMISDYPVASLEDFEDAVKDFLISNGNPELKGAAVSACGWQNIDGLTMPNYPFHLERNWLKALLHVERIHLVNECAVKAMSISHLKPDEKLHVCGSLDEDYYIRAVIGAGWGLGQSVILDEDPAPPVILHCEGGHSDVASTTPREFAVLDLLRQKFGRVSRERVISFAGLIDIWKCLSILDQTPSLEPTAEDIVKAARAGEAKAMESVDLCVGWLAAYASDVALTASARGGVYLTGGLVDLLGDEIDKAGFKSRFVDKGRLREYVEAIPVFRIVAPEPEFIGLSTVFD